MKKKIWMGFCTILTAAALAACGGNTNETAGAGEARTESAEALETDSGGTGGDGSGTDASQAAAPETDAGTAGTGSAEDTAEATGYVTGTVTAVGMSSITIRTENGDEMSFLKEEPVLNVENDMTEGLSVVIGYSEEGGMQTADYITDGILVTGEVTDAAMNTLEIKLSDGTVMQFTKEDAASRLKDGLLIGNQVAVAYREVQKEDGSMMYRAVFITDGQ